jgi:dihydroorotase-like cyclic amidohydrolase
MIAGAKAAGIRLSAETCPHYLFFASEEVPDGATEFKCCPPIRDAVNREALWRGLEAGVSAQNRASEYAMETRRRLKDPAGRIVRDWITP